MKTNIDQIKELVDLYTGMGRTALSMGEVVTNYQSRITHINQDLQDAGVYDLEVVWANGALQLINQTRGLYGTKASEERKA